MPTDLFSIHFFFFFLHKRQSSPAGYENFTKEALEIADNIRKKSVDLRATLDAIFLKAVKDLRSQAIQVNAALAQKVNVTEQICQEMEKELTKV